MLDGQGGRPSLPRLQTSSSTVNHGPSLTRSRPASPVLTTATTPTPSSSSAISLKDLAAARQNGKQEEEEEEARHVGYSRHGDTNANTNTPLQSVASSSYNVIASHPSTSTSTSSSSRVASSYHPASRDAAAALSPSRRSPHRQYGSNINSGDDRNAFPTSSRPSSRNIIRSRSPGSRNTSQSRSYSAAANNGGGVSRSSTPLLHYNSNSNHHQLGHIPDHSHSSSSFLLSGDSHTQLLPSAADQSSSSSNSTAETSSHRQNPIYRHDHYSTSKTGIERSSSNPFSPRGIISYRIKECISDVKNALAIGVQGEWRDISTGKLKIPNHLKAYIPLLIWVFVSIAFGVVIGIWHEQVFAGLDSLSTYLKSQGLLGDFILYLCIFTTTFPPLPLYSTLIILSGYSFGLLKGFIISYIAALSGAIVVYLCSKIWLKNGMEGLLNKSKGLKKVVRAIERRPRLLFLIRLSPYPYNVMNVLLASSSTLSFSCYFWCTALALPKLLIHCSVGTTIRSFADSAQHREEEDLLDDQDDEGLARELSGQRMKAIAGTVGLLLCVGVFIYLLIVARRAVDELDDDDDNENSLPIDGRSRSSSNVEGHSGYQGIPEGRTSMAEYRPLSAGLTSISIVRPTPDFKTSRELNSKMSMEETGFASENMHSPNMMMSGGRKSMNLNGSMVQRQVFERQNTTTTMTTASTFGESRSYDIELPPSYDRRWSIERENKERTAHGSERKGLLLDDGDDDDVEKDEEDEVRNGSVVDPLESIAYDRSQQRK